jgi:endonuclease-3 related protein
VKVGFVAGFSIAEVHCFTLNNMPAISAENQQTIRAFYDALYDAWGPQHWWPARTRFEVIVGAYLTQNTSWKNVEIALRHMRAARLLNLSAIRSIPLNRLEAVIRPAGYYRQKAERLKTFVSFVDRYYAGSLRRMFAQPTQQLREELLSLNGVGPETADSILLYAGQHAVFVVDAYTRRIMERHGITATNTKYEDLRELFEQALRETAPSKLRTEKHATGFRPTPHSPSLMSRAQRSPLAQIYNDMHGLIVAVGKHYCLKSEPRCEHCPLQRFLP